MGDTDCEKKKDTKKKILRQFKKCLSDILTSDYSDAVLMKFLRAGNLNLEKSEYLFRENYWSRILYGLNTFTPTTKKHEVAEKYEFVNDLGFAKDGTPITYVAMGRGDFYGFLQSMSGIDIALYCSLVLELDVQRAKERGRRLGEEMNEVTYIIDMEGFDLKSVFHTSIIEVAFDLFRMLQDQFPEIWKKLLVVNAAFYVYQTVNFFRPIFREKFMEHIRVVSKDDTPALLLEYIDADVLPVSLGGTRCDSRGDPACSEFMKYGGVVDQSYYSVHKPLLQETDPDAEVVWISARSCFNHNVLVLEPNSRITIEMRTEADSITTSVLYRSFGFDPDQVEFPSTTEWLNPRDPKSNVIQVSPIMKLQTHLCPLDNSFVAPEPGMYIFKFDNTYSWVRPRKLIFRIQVLSPS